MEFGIETERQLKELGAVASRTTYVKTKWNKWNGAIETINEPFGEYFFNSNDEEVCYFIYETFDLLGLTVHPKPRKWGKEAKEKAGRLEKISFVALENESYWERRREAERLRRESGDDSILGNPAY
jgi:hypothetical protein